MHRGTILLLASLFVVALAATAYAVPLLVELKLRDPLAVVTTPPATSDDLLVTGGNGKGNGKSDENGKSADKGNSGSHGKPDDPLSQGNLKSLTLWLSTDGKSWKALDAEVTDLGSDKITAKFGSKGKDSIDPATLGLPATESGTADSYYIGVSTSSTSFTGTAYSARLASWQVTSKTDAISTPEPAIWPLFALGAIGAGLALGRRKKA